MIHPNLKTMEEKLPPPFLLPYGFFLLFLSLFSVSLLFSRTPFSNRKNSSPQLPVFHVFSTKPRHVCNKLDTWLESWHVSPMQSHALTTNIMHSSSLALGHSSAKCPQVWCQVACTFMPRVALLMARSDSKYVKNRLSRNSMQFIWFN